MFQQMQEEEGVRNKTEEGMYNCIHYTINSNLFLPFVSEPARYLMHIIYCFFFFFKEPDEALDEFLAEDREAELRCLKSSQAEMRKLVCDALQMEWAIGEVVTPEHAKSLILQVSLPVSNILPLILPLTPLLIPTLILFLSVFLFSGFMKDKDGGQTE